MIRTVIPIGDEVLESREIFRQTLFPALAGWLSGLSSWPGRLAHGPGCLFLGLGYLFLGLGCLFLGLGWLADWSSGLAG